ncbi:putative siderophore biosynthesis protein [Talaromyces proteolyticus]|uniref:Siderophore biosynthesis protein n=1 Tax=Talaromyces proteolyticus TaxID=1131652 RepID=A0AAD4Q2K9_9EURO|nr:putative siderophore biosynthesis protein [Talaromyces proteolyticus]KAH8700522.1 putative siderophore biosynthesis protein [Talaromyces proteolyticus]
MPSSTCYLPNGNTFTITPVYGGVTFKSNDLNIHHSAFPPGWTVVIYTEKEVDATHHLDVNSPPNTALSGLTIAENDGNSNVASTGTAGDRKVRISSFKKPTLQNDCIFISSISTPSSNDFKPPTSPSRQIAMMLWATLWWYFHEPEPHRHLTTDASSKTPDAGKPKGDWRVSINREGIFKGRNLMQKMERMGLLASDDSSVGAESVESRNPTHWERLFTSRRSFWQLDPRIFIFTLTPAINTPLVLPSPLASPASPASPYGSRPTSPIMDGIRREDGSVVSVSDLIPPMHVFNTINGPYTSGSHLPTYYPPPPTQYVFTNGVRHPLRPRPPHQGETFYTRYIPSIGQKCQTPTPQPIHSLSSTPSLTVPQTYSPPPGPSDLDLLHKWMNDPRVNSAWNEAGPRSKQEKLLADGLSSKHSFPVFGCWDGKPFGYFEIYWVKEDRLGRQLGNAGNYDRGLHVLVGEQEFRGPHRVPVWLSSLVHYCWLADARTETVMLEPRVDNQKLISYLTDVGFYKEGEVRFPHKQSAVMKTKRDSWESPAL